MDHKTIGAEFLADNAKQEGVQTTASGLQYKVITEGEGAKPSAHDTVEVHYRGTLIDGTEFDSSYKRGQTIEFPLNRVIAGWTEGVQLMSPGAKYTFYIPYNLAYGERGTPGGPIPGYATLIFDVELVSVK
jgi:FKBP-type peptidyl-prolyl cis-trans isomerase